MLQLLPILLIALSTCFRQNFWKNPLWKKKDSTNIHLHWFYGDSQIKLLCPLVVFLCYKIPKKIERWFYAMWTKNNRFCLFAAIIFISNPYFCLEYDITICFTLYTIFRCLKLSLIICLITCGNFWNLSNLLGKRAGEFEFGIERQ